MNRLAWRTAGSVLLVATVGLAACGDDGGEASTPSTTEDDADTTTTTEAETTTTEALPPEDQAWADLEAGMETFSALAAEPDPEAPELARYFTGDSLEGLKGVLRDLQAGTGGSRNSVELHRYSVTVAGGSATVDYCFIDSSQHLDTSGQPVEEPEVTSMRATGQMQLVDGGWKLASQDLTPQECPQ